MGLEVSKSLLHPGQISEMVVEALNTQVRMQFPDEFLERSRVEQLRSINEHLEAIKNIVTNNQH